MDGKRGWLWAPLMLLAICLEWLLRWWRPIALVVLVGGIGLLAGCGTVPPDVVTVDRAVPVLCDVEEPARPALAIDSLPEGLPVDVQARHLRADHTLRDGYEGELRAALKTCIETGARAPP